MCICGRFAHHGGYVSAGDELYGGRRMQLARRANAAAAHRRRAAQVNRGYMSDSSSLRSTDARQHAAMGGSDLGVTSVTPSTLRRNVSAFGEITVMPVGDNEDEELKIAVDQQYLRRK